MHFFTTKLYKKWINYTLKDFYLNNVILLFGNKKIQITVIEKI